MLTDQEAIEKLREVAREHGWALAVHGSLNRDIDLIAAPWIETAASWYDLMCAMRKAIGKELGSLSNKPHGRIAFILLQDGAEVDHEKTEADGRYKTFWKPKAIDVSLIDPRSIEKPGCA